MKIHYLPNITHTHSKLRRGYFDMHIKDFKSKPTEKELYDLLEKWNFNFYRGDVKTMEAGIDEKLWLEVFGFDIDAKRLTTKNNEQHN